jgi:hypothetical protein
LTVYSLIQRTDTFYLTIFRFRLLTGNMYPEAPYSGNYNISETAFSQEYGTLPSEYIRKIKEGESPVGNWA